MSDLIQRHNDEWHMLFEMCKAENAQLTAALQDCVAAIEPFLVLTNNSFAKNNVREALAQHRELIEKVSGGN